MKRPSDRRAPGWVLALLAVVFAAVPLRAQDSTVPSTPREAVDSEKAAMKAELDSVRLGVEDAEQKQYTFLKRVERLANATGTRVNGSGWVLWRDGQSWGSRAGLPLSDRGFDALLDLDINGTVSKEVKYSGLFRLRSDLMPSLGSHRLAIRRIHLDLNPNWFSAVIGDFDESYTPFTLQNRDAHDFSWEPTFLKRPWSYAKRERFVGSEPDLPLRGARVGTALMWPDSKVLDRFRISSFGHYARSNFDTVTANYNGSSVFLYGARAEMIFRGGAALRAYGILYDEPLWSRPHPGYQYSVPATWQRAQRVGSVKPRYERRLVGRLTVGVEGEAAFSTLRADKREPYRNVSDYAMFGGPYLRWSAGTVRFNALEVGTDFRSPLAQTRQVDDRTGALLAYPVLTSLPEPGSTFAYYDRLKDNVFPYGWATPNRQGGGLELDLKFLEKGALKIRGAAYAVHEFLGNYVVTPDWLNVAPVDAPKSPTNPLRDFVYVNVGPRLDLKPLLGLKRGLEAACNVRGERTKSDVFGELKSDQIAAGVKVEALKGWWVEPGGLWGTFRGREAFLDGQYARAPYRFDNADLGRYVAAEVDRKVTTLGCSSTVEAGTNSKFVLDASLTETKDGGVDGRRVDRRTTFGYEVEF